MKSAFVGHVQRRDRGQGLVELAGADFGWEDGRLAAAFSSFSRDNGLSWEKLGNGDPAPDFAPGYANQQSAQALVGQYVDRDTNAIKLEDDEAIVLWDFNDLSGTGVDVDDLAMTVRFGQP